MTTRVLSAAALAVVAASAPPALCSAFEENRGQFAADATIHTVVGTGAAGSGRLARQAASAAPVAYPVGIGADACDGVFVTDQGSSRVTRAFRFSAIAAGAP